MTKFIRTGIADKNESPPYFDKALYEAEVDENEDIQHTVLTVTANSHNDSECIFFFFFLNRRMILSMCVHDIADASRLLLILGKLKIR